MSSPEPWVSSFLRRAALGAVAVIALVQLVLALLPAVGGLRGGPNPMTGPMREAEAQVRGRFNFTGGGQLAGEPGTVTAASRAQPSAGGITTGSLPPRSRPTSAFPSYGPRSLAEVGVTGGGKVDFAARGHADKISPGQASQLMPGEVVLAARYSPAETERLTKAGGAQSRAPAAPVTGAAERRAPDHSVALAAPLAAVNASSPKEAPSAGRSALGGDPAREAAPGSFSGETRAGPAAPPALARLPQPASPNPAAGQQPTDKTEPATTPGLPARDESVHVPPKASTMTRAASSAASSAAAPGASKKPAAARGGSKPPESPPDPAASDWMNKTPTWARRAFHF